VTESQPEQGIGSAEHTRNVPRKRVAATVIFTDERGRVLLCEPTYKQVWEAPGGAVEADESPRDAAIREVKEELGLVIEPIRLVALDWVPPLQGRIEGLISVFDGGRLTPDQVESIVLDSTELRSWSWCSISEVQVRMRDLVARRIVFSLKAIDEGATLYLESGFPVDQFS
jgi:8-oxo-dGTP pyrophosphatase MutT (NUDIX family)